MTQAGYLSSHVHDLVAIVATAHAIDVWEISAFLGAPGGPDAPHPAQTFREAAAPDLWIAGVQLVVNPVSRL